MNILTMTDRPDAQVAAPSDIVVAAGNNDGPHSMAFVAPPAASSAVAASARAQTAAFAAAVLSRGLVSDAAGRTYAAPPPDPADDAGGVATAAARLNATEFFLATGYHMKELPARACDARAAAAAAASGAAAADGDDAPPPRRCFAIALNTNLGVDNAVQNAALAADLAWAAALGGGGATAGVYLLGHHPRCPAFSSRLLLFSPSLRAGGWSRNRRSPAICGRASESSRGDVSAHRRRGPSAARHRRRRSSSAA
jgi:hypothetical protein